MATKRRSIRRSIRSRLSPEAFAAWQSCDYRALHCALGLRPNQASPLPREILPGLGCSESDLARINPKNPRDWDQFLPKALALQRQLLAAAGWPDCRQAYEANLREAEQWLAYVRRPPIYKGTGTDPASRAAAVKQAAGDVVYRRKLLAGS